MEHCFPNDGLHAVRPDEDVTRRSGPVLEAELDLVTWALSVALQALGREGTTARGQAVQ